MITLLSVYNISQNILFVLQSLWPFYATGNSHLLEFMLGKTSIEGHGILSNENSKCISLITLKFVALYDR